MLPDSNQLRQLRGRLKHTPKFSELQKQISFLYRQVLGKLIFAYVIARIDIGYALVSLACFSASPHKRHYKAMKQVCRYLQCTMDWGIIYWRRTPIEDLPNDNFVPIPGLDDSLPHFPVTHDPFKLVGYVDAAYGTCTQTRRSVAGFAFSLAGAAVAYKAKMQATIATSSTEAEFIAAVHAAKTAKYLQSVLDELDFQQKQQTPLYEDNLAAIKMVNSEKSTRRSRHINIQHFAIQEWK